MPIGSPESTLLRRGMKISHLRVLAALAETGQIGSAAERLGITQPAASRLLAEVERIIGHPVHGRTGRGVALTAVGEAMALRARRILRELRDADREMAEIAAGGRGHVRIGSVTAPAIDHILPAVRTARMSHPQITVEVMVDTSDNLCQALLSGRIDFAIGRTVGLADPSLIQIEMMEAEPISLMVRRDHALTRLPDLQPMDLMQYDWVMPRFETVLGRAVKSRLRSLGLPEPNQHLATSSFLLTLALLQHSNAIAPLARAVAEAFASDPGASYAILPIELGIEVEHFGLMTRAGTDLPPAARRVADLVRATPKLRG